MIQDGMVYGNLEGKAVGRKKKGGTAKKNKGNL